MSSSTEENEVLESSQSSKDENIVVKDDNDDDDDDNDEEENILQDSVESINQEEDTTNNISKDEGLTIFYKGGDGSFDKDGWPESPADGIPKDVVRIIIDSSVTKIGKGAFCRCDKIESIHIPESVTSIGNDAFRGCSSLASIQIPESVTSIGKYAFEDCSSLASIQIPESVKSIGESAFCRCSSLASIQIPESVTTIGYNAFYGCSSLASIQIPESVTSIANDAFNACPFSTRVANQNYNNMEELLAQKSPLHKLCNQNKKDLSKIKEYLDRKNDEKSDPSIEKDVLGRTPLHILALNPFITVEELDCFLEHNKDTAAQTDANDLLPLHYLCCNHGATNGVLLKMVQAYPQALSAVAGNYGMPLKLALWNNLPTNITHELFAYYPIGNGLIRDKDKDKLKSTAHEYIVRLKHLLITKPNDFNPLWQHGWVTFVSNQDVFNIDAKKLEKDCIDLISSCDDAAVKLLAKAKNVLGSTAIQIAVPKIQQELKKRLLFLGRYDPVTKHPIHKSATCIVIKAYDENKRDQYRDVFKKYSKQTSLNKDQLNACFAELGYSQDDRLIVEYFEKFDLDKSESISEQEFIDMCVSVLDGGQRHEVVFKFMKDKQQFQREIKFREDFYLKPEHVVSVIDFFNSNDVSFKSVLKDIVEPQDVDAYKDAILMPFADRNLDTIFRSEQPEIGRVRDYIKQIAESVKHLHDQGIVHGDLKLLNIVRLYGRMTLIDLDASVKKSESDKKTFIGNKFSSGVLPPEMIYCIQNNDDFDKYKEYFEKEQKPDTKRWDKIKPIKTGGSKPYVVKTFNTENRDEVLFGEQKIVESPVNTENLPCNLVEATSAVDAWSLGVIFFTLLAGEPLFSVNRDDDLKDGSAMQELFEWNKDSLELKMSDFPQIPRIAKDLLRKLLQPLPSDRPTMKQVLTDAFFDADKVDTALEKLKEGQEELKKGQYILMDLSHGLQAELSRTRSILLYGMFEATEVQTPTAFIITKNELQKPTCKDRNNNDKLAFDDILDEKGKGFKPEALLSEDQKEMVENCKKRMDEAKLWTSRVKSICTGVLEGNVDQVFGTVKGALGDLVSGEKMYFYFIDELTGEPVHAKGYPKEITKPSDLVPKLLPLMQVSMRAISLCNGVAGIARVFGFPLPTIPEEVRSNMQDSVDILKQESSVEAFGSLQEVVTDLGDSSEKKEAKQTVRGESLRQLLEFLKPEIEDKNFAGLNRYPDPETGRAIWTRLKTRDEVEEALDKISKQRRAEEGISTKIKDNAKVNMDVLKDKNKFMNQEIERLESEIGEKEQEIERLKPQLSFLNPCPEASCCIVL